MDGGQKFSGKRPTCASKKKGRKMRMVRERENCRSHVLLIKRIGEDNE